MLVGASTATVVMDATVNQYNRPGNTGSDPSQEHTKHFTAAATTDSGSNFHEAQCLFCNQIESSLDHNLAHMSKDHGLYIDTADLLVDIESLLAYMHLLIFDCHECLCCGTQRHTRQAIQQHMMAKGHCRYDIEDEESELRDFYQTNSQTKAVIERNISLLRLSDEPTLFSRVRPRKAGKIHQTEHSSDSTVTYPANQFASNTGSRIDTDPEFDADGTSATSTELSTRILKHEHNLNNQLARLRAGDRHSLAHMPAAQQRALLATHHKQLEQGRRAEQTYRGNLDSSGNKFGRLSTIRLVRKPPHTGNIHSLNK